MAVGRGGRRRCTIYQVESGLVGRRKMDWSGEFQVSRSIFDMGGDPVG